MKFEEQKDLDPIAVLTEYDVHDLLCNGRAALLQLLRLDDIAAQKVMNDQCGCVDHIRIEPTRPELFNDVMIAHWNYHLNALFSTIQKLDGLIHEDAEYTC